MEKVSVFTQNFTLDHKIWGNAETVTKMERLISGLGSSPLDSPALLTWTLRYVQCLYREDVNNNLILALFSHMVQISKFLNAFPKRYILDINPIFSVKNFFIRYLAFKIILSFRFYW